MEEKKLTDEEIIKALELCVKNDCEKCPYLIKGFDCVISKQAENDFLDLIHRLQDENKKLEKDVHDMSWIIKVHKYCVGADHCQNSSTREYELQKQVDELTEKLGKVLLGVKADELLVAKGVEQAVKDTAKEIFQMLKKYFGNSSVVTLHDIQRKIEKMYRVEVE